MENRAYIPEEAYQLSIRPIPTAQELAQSGIVDLSSSIKQKSALEYEAVNLKPEKNIFDAEKKIVQYDIDFDRQQAQELRSLQNAEGFENRVSNFKSYTEMQLLTALGERFNRGLSNYSYRSINGVLYAEHSDEPILDVFERGRAYRTVNGNAIDHPREYAEVVGFAKIQEYMKDAPVGATVISVSQPGGEGSIYKHNFYDGFQKREDGSIDVTRFSNALNANETLQKLQEVDPLINVPEDLSSEYLLSNPIILSPDLPHSLEEIHQHIHKDHEVMSEEDFEYVKKMCAFLIVSYINSLLEDPSNVEHHNRLYNALLNKADEAADARKFDTFEYVKSSSEMSHDEIYYLGMQEVREVDTGCGFSGGMAVGESANGAYSVVDYGNSFRLSTEIQDQYGGLEFSCPGCKKKNKRPFGKLIRNCGEGQIGGCGRDVTC